MRASRGVKWEDKMYKLKRSIAHYKWNYFSVLFSHFEITVLSQLFIHFTEQQNVLQWLVLASSR